MGTLATQTSDGEGRDRRLCLCCHCCCASVASALQPYLWGSKSFSSEAFLAAMVSALAYSAAPASLTLPTQRAWCRSLPRIGLHFGVPKKCEQVQWYGAGPHECYWDRKSGAPIREYSSTVQDMHVPYIVPGESLFIFHA